MAPVAEAILMLSDKDGQIAMDVSYEGAFDRASPAHQHMALLLKAMDTLAMRQPDPVPQADAPRLLDATGEPLNG